MSYERLAYDDHDTSPRMASDCLACSTEMQFTGLNQPGGSSHQHKFKHEISIDLATAHLAERLHLHLDGPAD